MVAALAFAAAVAGNASAASVVHATASAPNKLVFSGAVHGTVTAPRMTSCDAGSGGMQWPLDATLLPSTAHNWSLTLVYPGNGTYKSFVFGGKSSFVLQSGLNAWVATSGSFTIHGKKAGVLQLDETGTVNLTLGGHEGSATGTVHVKGSWKCG